MMIGAARCLLIMMVSLDEDAAVDGAVWPVEAVAGLTGSMPPVARYFVSQVPNSPDVQILAYETSGRDGTQSRSC